jgi:hypothetical protein
MSDAEMDTVRRHVRDGGGLVATYETSRYDEHAKLRNALGLADLLRAKPLDVLDARKIKMDFSGKPQTAAAMYMPPSDRWTSDPQIAEALARHNVTQPLSLVGHIFSLDCRMLLVDPAEGLRCPLRLNVSRLAKPGAPLQHASYPAIIETSYGKGKVIYIPMDLSWIVFRYGYAHFARMLELALRETASAPPPVEVTAPSIVQTMVHVQGDRLVVHLLNDISSLGRSQNVAGQSLYERREVIPIHDIALTFRDTDLHHLFLMPGHKPLTPVTAPQGLTVTLPPLEIHAMVVGER